MILKYSYSLIAPFYDAILEKTTAPIRQQSIAQIDQLENKKTLLMGIGTGLDIPYLPKNADITGIDITPAMLRKARQRALLHQCNIQLKECDAMNLPYENEQFDVVIMHLILAVVPDSAKALSEASRVLKKGGLLIIFDKFLKPGQLALTKRLMNLFIRHIATKTNVVIEPLLAKHPELTLLSDQPVLANGWFRRIACQKK